MFRITLKSILGHKQRLVSTSLAIILGVAFVAGTLVFTDTVQGAFDDLFETINEKTAAEVRSSAVVESPFGSERGRIPADTLEKVQSIEGVRSAVGVVQGSAQMVDPDGELVGQSGNGPPKFGFNWFEDDDLNPWRLEDGRAPTGSGEVAIDLGAAELAEIGVGDTIQVLTTLEPESFEIVGVVTFGSAKSAGGSTSALFDLATAQRLFDAEGEYDVIDMTADEGVSQDDLVARVTAELDDPGVDVISGEALTEESQTEVKEAFSFFTIFLLVFAFIAMFVGSFVIYNTFAIIVTQRSKEMALLRAVGASRRQILGSVLLEALVVGTLASIVGIFAGVGVATALKAILSAAGLGLPAGPLTILPRTMMVGLVAGLVVTLFAAISPALKASRIAPIEALRSASIDSEASSRKRLIGGLVITGLGIIALLIGLLQPQISLVGVGAAALFVGLLTLGPILAPFFTRIISAPLPRFKGIVGSLARDNSMRNPTRTSRTAAALLVGVALVSAVTVLASSLKASIRDIVEEGFVGDFAVDSGSFGEGGLSPQLTADLNALPEVKVATGLRFALGDLDGETEFLSSVEPETALELFDIGLPDGVTADDLGPEEIFVFTDRAEDLGLGVDDSITARFSDGKIRQLRISALYDESALAGNYTISHALSEEVGGEAFDLTTFATLTEGVTIADARPTLEALVDEYPNATLQDREEYADAQAASLDLLVNMIYGLLALAVIIAAFGIANTLRLSVLERTREIGLLRAVGMSRRQTRSVIRWEAVITAILGALQGVLVGLALGYAVIYALRSEGINKFSVPSFSLVIIVLLAAVIGVLAARRPAKRAADMDVLDAITHE